MNWSVFTSSVWLAPFQQIWVSVSDVWCSALHIVFYSSRQIFFKSAKLFGECWSVFQQCSGHASDFLLSFSLCFDSAVTKRLAFFSSRFFAVCTLCFGSLFCLNIYFFNWNADVRMIATGSPQQFTYFHLAPSMWPGMAKKLSKSSCWTVTIKHDATATMFDHRYGVTWVLGFLLCLKL